MAHRRLSGSMVVHSGENTSLSNLHDQSAGRSRPTETLASPIDIVRWLSRPRRTIGMLVSFSDTRIFTKSSTFSFRRWIRFRPAKTTRSIRIGVKSLSWTRSRTRCENSWKRSPNVRKRARPRESRRGRPPFRAQQRARRRRASYQRQRPPRRLSSPAARKS